MPRGASHQVDAASRAEKGRLPNFFIIGAQKSGTSSLRRYLHSHPDAFCQGESHFFDFHYERGIDWYRRRFASAGAVSAVGEKCPDYLFHPRALERIASVVPDARHIAILRDPVERAYSHYRMMREMGHDSLGFARAIETEAERLARGEWQYAYAARGRYLPQLERVCEYVPRSSLLVLLFEDLRDDPDTAFEDACRFLGIDSSFRPQSLGRVYNPHRILRGDWLHRIASKRWGKGRRPKLVGAAMKKLTSKRVEYEAMDSETGTRLAEHFAADNEALAAWLGRDLGAWTRA